jgi:hypothetical protein
MPTRALGAGHVAAAMPWGMRSRSPSPDWDFITHYEATVTVHLPGSGGYNLFLLLLFVGLFVCLFVVVFFAYLLLVFLFVGWILNAPAKWAVVSAYCRRHSVERGPM